jgi:hypothetical protein
MGCTCSKLQAKGAGHSLHHLRLIGSRSDVQGTPADLQGSSCRPRRCKACRRWPTCVPAQHNQATCSLSAHGPRNASAAQALCHRGKR